MKINEKCVSCKSCVPHCPVGAIMPSDKAVQIDQDLCVECGVCYRAQVCPVNAIYQPELSWPRTLRTQFSNPVAYRHPTTIGGRGTDEMKTNDVTNRFNHGETGLCIELGRPGVGATFGDLEKVTMQLARAEVEFEPENPTTLLIDTKTGKLKDETIRSERVLSCIAECKTDEQRVTEVLKALEGASKAVNTVFSIGIINRCKNGEIPVRSLLARSGFRIYPNGKTNLGLGRVGN